MNKLLIRTVAMILLLFAVLVVASQTLGLRPTVFDQFDLLVDVRHELLRNYVDPVDESQLVEAAVRAMVDSLGDQHTVYISPEEQEDFTESIEGSFSGIGAYVETYDDRLRIVSPLDDSPAYHAGVLAGDIVLTIDGVDTEGMAMREAISRLKGQAGTPVTIRVRHETGEEAQITIIRAVINVPTVRGIRRDASNNWSYILDPHERIGYIRISQFTQSTAAELEQAITQLKAQNPAGLILDLRFNPGGLLDAAVAVSDMFLEKGKLIVSVKGRRIESQSFESQNPPLLPDLPIVVLVNDGSASASEIVSGALKDNGRAVVVGSRSYGKGSVQQLHPLPKNHGLLKITHAHYFGPSGRRIHRVEGAETWGVDPSEGFYVPMTTDQVREMLRVRRASDVLRAENGDAEHDDAATPQSPTPDTPPANGSSDDGAPDASNDNTDAADAQTPAEEPVNITWPEDDVTPAWIGGQLKDRQLAAALLALEGRVATNTWPHVGRDDADLQVKLSRREALQKRREVIQEALEEIDSELTKLRDELAAPSALETRETDSDEPAPGPHANADQPGDDDADPEASLTPDRARDAGLVPAN